MNTINLLQRTNQPLVGFSYLSSAACIEALINARKLEPCSNALKINTLLVSPPY
jgi:hypothetical protein